jgi:hypothetical protein
VKVLDVEERVTVQDVAELLARSVELADGRAVAVESESEGRIDNG